ncbi:MAG: Zn-ribbon domain-containing OB-fold protein [Cytophagales bacterium]|nr:Zn-ribbon domain-containing OB-fold protein [Rhizobacter sp.]
MQATRGPEAEYAAALSEGRFLIQRCGACSQHVFYPRTLCPHCGAEKLAWVAPCGRGTVYSVSVIAGKPGTGSDYHVALIDLDEGVRMMSRVEGVAHAQVHIGMKVQAAVQRNDEGRGLVVFTPREGA